LEIGDRNGARPAAADDDRLIGRDQLSDLPENGDVPLGNEDLAFQT
jgi:hypothetical protein